MESIVTELHVGDISALLCRTTPWIDASEWELVEAFRGR